MKHTSGPWHVAPLASTWVGTKYGEQVASTDTFDIEDKEEQQANALLIAASPDLLDALRELLAVAPSTPPAAGLIVGIEQRHRAALDAARAAVKKATGDEP